MKKIFLSVFAVVIAAVSVIGCGNAEKHTKSKAEIQATAVSKTLSSEQETKFTIDDIRDLQDFLLAKPTDKNLRGKPYDLDGDGAWTVFDLCLMKRQLLQSMQPPENEAENTLVVYFSRTGNTEKVAEYLIDLTDADSYVINAAVPYTDEDISYGNSSCRANQEQNDSSVRPEIAEPIESIEQYDTIFLGYPIWWGQEPRIIDTFLESYDFSDKTVIPFCSSHSSGISASERNIKNLVKIGEQLSGRRFSADSTKDDVSEWLGELGLLKEREIGVFDFNSKTVMLNSGYEMPIMGLGTYSLLDDTCVESVKAELQSGGRLIDTAYMYHNEEAVGKGIKESGVPREEIFVETKLYPNQYDDAANAIDEALKKLDVDYIDLMLLHHPGAHDVDAYKAMEQAVKDGKIHSIGLSNWYIEELNEFLPQVDIVPALVQNEIHPFYQELEVVPYIQSLGIVMQGWYPLGGRGYTADLLGNETINDIADAHDVSAAQVILRWNLQRSVIVIPGSSNSEHIKENLDLFSFKLTDDEMQRITELNRDEKHDWY